MASNTFVRFTSRGLLQVIVKEGLWERRSSFNTTYSTKLSRPGLPNPAKKPRRRGAGFRESWANEERTPTIGSEPQYSPSSFLYQLGDKSACYVLNRAACRDSKRRVPRGLAVRTTHCVAIAKFWRRLTLRIRRTECSIPSSKMETQKPYTPMGLDDTESEAFLAQPISWINHKRKVTSKVCLLGWAAAIVQFAIICYGRIYPRNPTDLECTQQLISWCKWRQPEAPSQLLM
jgi:signal recognition particle subunit SEC65